jgi:heavy metal sensor kinase
MNPLKTLRARFALWTAGLLFAALVGFGVFVYANMSYSLSAAVDETLQLVVLQLLVEAELRRGQFVSLEHSIEDPQYAELRKQGLSMRVLNQSGGLVEEYGPYTDLPSPSLDFSAPGYSSEFVTITDAGTHDRVRVFTSPIVVEDQIVGVLQVAQNLNNVGQTLDRLIITLLIGVPLVVILASGGGYFLAARALAPIDRITRTARQISAQDLSARLNLPQTNDEVGRLAETFDSMLSRLNDGFRRERQFTTDASHELRTPLSAMQTIISSTVSRSRDPAEYEQALIDLNHETERMKTLTEGLLYLAHQDALQQPAKFERLDLSLLLEDVVDSLAPLAEVKGLKLIDSLQDNKLLMMGDRDGLIRLFVNLVDNAIKYTDHGSITITTSPKDAKGLTVIVSDTGRGITPEHLPRIFDRFYRIDQSRSKDGTGLGLAIARNVARAHGGDITVESKVGEGTKFIVQLSTGGEQTG